MTIDGRRFSVTMPDWGQDHLSPEAVVAFVDDELADGPFTRATRHLDTCSECLTQVAAQGQARSALRSAAGPSLPSSLFSSLCSIPQDTDLPAAPAGLAMTPDGEFVSLLRTEPVPPAPPPAARTDHGRRPPASRRMRFGAGAAMSGLALGAIALGATGVASDSPPPVSARPEGIFGGSVVDAQLRISPATGATPTGTDAVDQVRLIPGMQRYLP